MKLKHWTLEEDVKLAEAYRTNTGTQADFCKHHGSHPPYRTPKAVMNRLYHLGLDSPKANLALVRFERLYAAFCSRGESGEEPSRNTFLTYLLDIYEEDVKTLVVLNQANGTIDLLRRRIDDNQEANPA